MKNLTANEKRVIEVLGTGKNQARNVSDLSKLIGIDRRSFDDIVFRLTLKGAPIVGNRTGENKGVYIAENEDEKRAGLQALASQIKNMTKRAQAVEASDLKTWKDIFKDDKN